MLVPYVYGATKIYDGPLEVTTPQTVFSYDLDLGNWIMPEWNV